VDINNLEAFAPKPKGKASPGTSLKSIPKDSLSEPISISTTKVQTNSDGVFYPTEFSCYGNIEIAPDPVPSDQGTPDEAIPVIDLYILSKNCSEYIILNEEYKQFNNIDKLSNVLEIAKRSYFRSLSDSMGIALGISKIEFITPSYIFRDYIWDDYNLDFDTKEIILIDKFFTYVKNKEIIQNNFIILKTDTKDPFYNLSYCSLCTFRKICTRSSLV
jgi:hypothetical protein